MIPLFQPNDKQDSITSIGTTNSSNSSCTTTIGTTATPPSSSSSSSSLLIQPAAVISKNNKDTLISSNELQATASMCHYCFDLLIESLLVRQNQQQPYSYSNASTNHLNRGSNNGIPICFLRDLPNNSTDSDVPNEYITVPNKYPIFITWEKQQLNKNKSISTTNTCIQYELRGCIGTLEPVKCMTLDAILQEYTYQSAYNDRRFQPITLYEVSSLRCSVSLLSKNYEICNSYDDWIIGTHGIIIKFNDPSNNNAKNIKNYTSYNNDNNANTNTYNNNTIYKYNATFLPEVAIQQKWDHKQTIIALIKKSGYNGVIDDALVLSSSNSSNSNIHYLRYKSSKYNITYNEYIQTIDPYINKIKTKQKLYQYEQQQPEKDDQSITLHNKTKAFHSNADLIIAPTDCTMTLGLPHTSSLQPPAVATLTTSNNNLNSNIDDNTNDDSNHGIEKNNKTISNIDNSIDHNDHDDSIIKYRYDLLQDFHNTISVTKQQQQKQQQHANISSLTLLPSLNNLLSRNSSSVRGGRTMENHNEKRLFLPSSTAIYDDSSNNNTGSNNSNSNSNCQIM